MSRYKVVRAFLAQQAAPVSRAVIQSETGLPKNDCDDAIGYLKEAGEIEAIGERGSRVYRLLPPDPEAARRHRENMAAKKRAQRQKARDEAKRMGAYRGAGRPRKVQADQRIVINGRTNALAPAPIQSGPAETVDQFLARGGSIQVLDRGASSGRDFFEFY